VLNRQQLTRGAAVTVVRVADRAMILGVTDQQVSFLGEAEVAAFERPPVEHRDSVSLGDELPGAHPAGGARFMEYLRERTSRR
jgi:flagellar protein FliO/FliZ